jgi:hypothetical protein
MNNEDRPDREPANKYRDDQATRDSRPAVTVRRNPRLVVGGLDYFDLLMEQDEQK